MDDIHGEFIRKARQEYRTIGCTPCPAFGNEPVYFTPKGFKHLVFKNGSYRPVSDQKRRISLLRKAVYILKSSKSFFAYRNIQSSKSMIHLWSFMKECDDIEVIVVVEQIDKGRKIFLSVMDRRR